MDSNVISLHATNRMDRIVLDPNRAYVCTRTRYTRCTRCTGHSSYCKKTKSSLEVKDLLQMGFPSFLLRKCPVVPFSRTTYTVELAELIMTLMTSELGAGQISAFISKRRIAYWAASARVYLEATMVSMERDSHRGNLSSYGFSRVNEVVEPFPLLLSHCDGFGGSKGPSSRNIQRFL